MRATLMLHPVLAVVVEEQGFGAALALVVAGARAQRVDVAPVAFRLRVDGRVAVDLGGGGLKDPHAQAQPSGGTESAFDRINRTKTMRIAVLPGELPYFQKDLATGEWKGAAIDFAKDIAKVFDAKLDYVESTYGNSVLDLQSQQDRSRFRVGADAGSGRFPSGSPGRSSSIHTGALPSKGFNPKTWDGHQQAGDHGSFATSALTHETAARRFAPKAQITALKSRDEATLYLSVGAGRRVHPGRDARVVDYRTQPHVRAVPSADGAAGGFAELLRCAARAGYQGSSTW